MIADNKLFVKEIVLYPMCFIDSTKNKTYFEFEFVLACDCVPVDAGFQGAHFYVVDAHRVLAVGVARQPRDDRRAAGNVGGSDGGGTQRDVFAHHHGARGVARGPSVWGHGPHTYAVGLRKLNFVY